jgi:hypothetical protein
MSITTVNYLLLRYTTMMILFKILHVILSYCYWLYIVILSSSRQQQQHKSHTAVQFKAVNHLAIVVNDDDCNDTADEKLCEIIQQISEWCLLSSFLSIKQLTFYDSQGVIRRHHSSLMANLLENKTTLNDNDNTFRIELSGGEKIIHLLDYTTCGRPYISKAAHNIITSCNNNSSAIDSHVQQEIVKCKSQLINNEPDLMIVFSPVCNLHGFSPLHLRYTQIIHNSDSILNFTEQKLIDCFIRYSNCEQRYGT